MIRHLACSVALSLATGGLPALADPIETFDTNPETRWQFVADTVMGGVSTGGLHFHQGAEGTFARLEGEVSTQNNGGFIQFRHLLQNPPPENSTGVRLIVRGNTQPYFIHLRTTGTRLPWQYYQARFDTSGQWTEIRLPFTSFERSGRLLRRSLRPSSVTSVGVVAYGRDHSARVDVREIGFY